MKTRPSRIACLFTLSLLAGSAFAANGIQPGLWEVKVTQQIMDGKDMQAQMAAMHAQMAQSMQNMPPAQRQRMEQVMGGHMGSGGSTQICISPSMASMDKPIPPKDMQCDTLKTSRNGNTLNYEISCKNKNRSMSGKGQSTYSNDLVKNTMDMQTQDARGQHHMQMASEMHFVSSNCGSVKPVDEIVKEAQAAQAGRQH